MQTSNVQTKILRRKEVCNCVGLSYTSVFRLERTGRFPSRIRLSPMGRSVGWLESEIFQWIAERERVVAVQP